MVVAVLIAICGCGENAGGGFMGMGDCKESMVYEEGFYFDD